MKLVVIDYGMGNLGSVRRSIEDCGAQCVVSGHPRDLDGGDGFVLPGVGSFREGMDRLRSLGFADVIKEATKNGMPLLGICLGMQLLADHGEEGGSTDGLGLIPGKIQKLSPKGPDERIPHVGWNEVVWAKGIPIALQIPLAADFYFVHSYHFVPKNSHSIAAKTPYCGEFVSAVFRDQIYGTQFHPEKSSKGGSQLLKNFIKICSTRSVKC